QHWSAEHKWLCHFPELTGTDKDVLFAFQGYLACRSIGKNTLPELVSNMDAHKPEEVEEYNKKINNSQLKSVFYLSEGVVEAMVTIMAQIRCNTFAVKHYITFKSMEVEERESITVGRSIYLSAITIQLLVYIDVNSVELEGFLALQLTVGGAVLDQIGPSSLSKALKIMSEIYVEESLPLGEWWDNVASMHAKNNNFYEASMYVKQSISTVQKVFGYTSPEVAEEMCKLTGLLQRSYQVMECYHTAMAAISLFKTLGLDESRQDDFKYLKCAAYLTRYVEDKKFLEE
ncbi:hypothetical protein CU098_013916, partial [Rhizopus stolonifer]